MADPLSIACSVTALTTFAISATLKLSATVRSFENHNKQSRALLEELNNLVAILETLLETIQANPDIDFDQLATLLDRCGKTCVEYGDLIAQFTKHSTVSRRSVRDWIKQKYLQGDVTDLREMLAGYKSTITIAIANVNM
jgi:hypothetical protein